MTGAVLRPVFHRDSPPPLPRSRAPPEQGRCGRRCSSPQDTTAQAAWYCRRRNREPPGLKPSGAGAERPSRSPRPPPPGRCQQSPTAHLRPPSFRSHHHQMAAPRPRLAQRPSGDRRGESSRQPPPPRRSGAAALTGRARRARPGPAPPPGFRSAGTLQGTGRRGKKEEGTEGEAGGVCGRGPAGSPRPPRRPPPPSPLLPARRGRRGREQAAAPASHTPWGGQRGAERRGQRRGPRRRRLIALTAGSAATPPLARPSERNGSAAPRPPPPRA
ncbi:basic salivary proline-rich protein 4-like [Neopsephotus bourkii]|uniref:basic salivary proline-rich protein 4-like n=1 Tax=Neopsephotus bourkii TaxID=309878 RepID=UPI002AA581FA|nr:basic salivary proline-rich protein 4-like [Neopsephotus bourkii]